MRAADPVTLGAWYPVCLAAGTLMRTVCGVRKPGRRRR
jgi:hypothetical protein